MSRCALQAVARAVVLAGSDGARAPVDRSAKLAHLARLRDRLGLMRKSDLDEWAARNGLDGQGLRRCSRPRRGSRRPAGSRRR
jgi:hypothetical protein